jgi:hypothetical protein
MQWWRRRQTLRRGACPPNLHAGFSFPPHGHAAAGGSHQTALLTWRAAGDLWDLARRSPGGQTTHIVFVDHVGVLGLAPLYIAAVGGVVLLQC